MDYEKKYKEALSKAREFYNDEQTRVGMTPIDLESIFPELKESEDEKIRKWLIGYFHQYKEDGMEKYANGLKVESIIAWLEKQGEVFDKIVERARTGKQRVLVTESDGVANIDWDTRSLQDTKLLMEYGLNYIKKIESKGEQKPADKVETKFHEGDWVILTAGELSTTLQIAKVDTNKKLYWFNDSRYLPIVDEECLHFWTIQDAKDGDVLATEDKNFVTPFVAIYKSLDDTIYNGLRYNTTFNSRCFIGFNGNFYIGEEGHAIEDIHPATKEQRDILFQKMKESGYEWDAEKKELKKAEQKTAWSEEDKRKLNRIYSILREAADTHAFSTSCRLIGDKECVELQDFLKSIVLQNTWKPSDEQMYKKVETAIDSYYAPFSRDAEEMSEWLKNIKNRVQHQNTWKPSDEQMIALRQAISG